MSTDHRSLEGTKPLSVAGNLFVIAGLVLLRALSMVGSYAADVVPSMVVLGIRVGLGFAPINIAGLSAAPERDNGFASTVLNGSQIGNTVGLAITVAARDEPRPPPPLQRPRP